MTYEITIIIRNLAEGGRVAPDLDHRGPLHPQVVGHHLPDLNVQTLQLARPNPAVDERRELGGGQPQVFAVKPLQYLFSRSARIHLDVGELRAELPFCEKRKRGGEGEISNR